jgi:hypothetical protein
LLFAGCAASTPTIDHTHPASVEAAESATKPLPRMLTTDAATQRTRDLLAQRAAEAKAAETEGATETPAAPSEKKTDHSGHNMPGMKKGAGHENH